MKYLFQVTVFLVTFYVMFCLCDELTDSQIQQEAIYRELFKQRRAEQIQSVKQILTMKQDQRLKMLMTVTKAIFDMIVTSRVVLENSGYTPGISDFPEDEKVRDALSHVLENTALLSDIILRLPDLSQNILRSTADWVQVFSWSLIFANETQLIDKSTMKLFNLVSQEMNFINRSPDYRNPYRKENAPEKDKQDKKIKKKSKSPKVKKISYGADEL